MGCTLALDTTTFDTGVAVVLGDGQGFELFDIPERGGRPGHASKALGLAEDALKLASCSWSDVSAVAVAVGPGSFTGLRVGIATAKAIGLGLGVEVRGASSLQALVAGVHAAAPSTEIAVCALIDARRGELFCSQSASGHQGMVLKPQESDLWIESIPAGALCVGDGALLHRDELVKKGFEVPDPDSQHHRISPISVVAVSLEWEADRDVLPQYVREADAVPTSERKGAQASG